MSYDGWGSCPECAVVAGHAEGCTQEPDDDYEGDIEGQITEFEDFNADYREIFGRNPEPWRAPLGALRLTLTPGDPYPWVLPDGSRDIQQLQPELLPNGSVGPLKDFGAVYDPRPEYDPPWTLARAREEVEELIKVLNGVKK